MTITKTIHKNEIIGTINLSLSTIGGLEFAASILLIIPAVLFGPIGIACWAGLISCILLPTITTFIIGSIYLFKNETLEIQINMNQKLHQICKNLSTDKHSYTIDITEEYIQQLIDTRATLIQNQTQPEDKINTAKIQLCDNILTAYLEYLKEPDTKLTSDQLDLLGNMYHQYKDEEGNNYSKLCSDIICTKCVIQETDFKEIYNHNMLLSKTKSELQKKLDKPQQTQPDQE